MSQNKGKSPKYKSKFSRPLTHDNVAATTENKKSKEEEQLEKTILGEGKDVINKLDNFAWTTKNKRKRTKKSSASKVVRKPVWNDETDQTETQVKIPKRSKTGTLYYENKETNCEELTEELKNKFASVSGTPSWAQLDKNKSSKDDDILKRVGNFIKKTNQLATETIDINMCKNLASDLDERGSVIGLEFHPKAQVALVANSKRKVVLRQVDGVNNPIIQKVVINGFPITCARFTADGEHFIVSSDRFQHFYNYDMMTGNISKVQSNRNLGKINMEKFHLSPDGQLMVISGSDGYIYVLSAKTKEYLYSSKMNSSLRGVTFSPEGTRMYTHSDEGEVYIWDVRQKNCLHKFQDDGCIHGTSIALSTSEQYLATGSDTGVVNIYDTSSLQSSSYPTPYNTFLNLTTAVTELKFNSSSELLAMASSEKPAAFKLVHCSNMSVFKNIPFHAWKLGSVSCLNISPNSGFLAAGTTQGVANLFRLNHYGSY